VAAAFVAGPDEPQAVMAAPATSTTSRSVFPTIRIAVLAGSLQDRAIGGVDFNAVDENHFTGTGGILNGY